jgi:protein involved in polysaccharide export with SLBB domain
MRWLALAAAVVAGWIGCPVVAQAIDPRVLETLQQSIGASQAGAQGAAAPRDAAPASGVDTQSSLPQQRVDTPEEQDLRRAQARRDLAELYEPSAIEADFRARLKDPTLRQFGYDYFRAAPPPTGVRTGAIGDDYILGIGDEVTVAFRGATNDSRTARVDRDGQLIVGQLRPIPAAGRSLGAVKAQIAAETRSTLLATDVFVSVGAVRSVSVFVGGEVERPGQFSLTSVSDIATALSQAGGIRRTGSLRSVRLVRGGTTRLVDLYGLLGIGSTPVIRLQDGDRIIVPVIGQTIAVTGAVARPAIYEVRGPIDAATALSYAGGPVRARGAEIVISRIDGAGVETFLRGAGKTTRVEGGDAVIVFAGTPGGAAGRVALSGFVDNPGPRPLAAAPTIAELVGPPDYLRNGTYQTAAILKRVDAATGARVLEMVPLARELRGAAGILLRNQDELVILGRDDIAFLNSAPVRAIVVGQPNPLPQCRSLDRLSSLVRDTEAARFTAVTRGNLVVRDAAGSATLASSANQLGAGVRNTESLRRSDLADDVSAEAGPCSPLFEKEPDLLPFLLEHAISVGGSVRQPGAFPVAGTTDARDLLVIAEGLVTGVTGVTLDVNRAGAPAVERISLDAGETALRTTLLEPGDDIRFNGQPPAFEGAGVVLSGEVVKPGLYAIRKGETLSQLLARAGGLTEYAYAYGAIFTRQSVKEAEQEGYRRTARELNNSLLAITSRSQGRGTEGLEGAAALIQLIAGAEATGRVVVEADPRVLALRPDLDTVLQPGDSLFIPKRPNYVLVLGDLLNPGAQQFVAGKSAPEYLNGAGGTLSTADEGRTYLVLPNGTAQPVRSRGWGATARVTPPPGSTVVVPKNIDPLYKLSVFRDVATIFGQLAISAATIGVLANN